MREVTNIWAVCPLCGQSLEGNGFGGLGRAKCEKGHYEYCAMGSYASEGTIIIDGVEEKFHFDDMFDDSDKFDIRVKQLREQLFVPNDIKGLREGL